MNIWADAEALSEALESYMVRDLQTALSLTGLRANEQGYVLVPHARLALTMGERVCFGSEVDMFPIDVVEPGERAVVGRRDKITGAVELFLEQHHIRLAEYSNTVTVTPHQDQDTLRALEPYGDMWTAPVFVDLKEYQVA